MKPSAGVFKTNIRAGRLLEALAQGVRHEQDWWYVSVRPSQEPDKQFEYYEALAEVEMEVLKAENIIVLLLPTPAAQ